MPTARKAKVNLGRHILLFMKKQKSAILAMTLALAWELVPCNTRINSIASRLEDHKTIMSALKNHDPGCTAGAMKVHLANLEEKLRTATEGSAA